MTPEQCRRARKRLGWSSNALGALVGLHASTITNYESGRKNLSHANAARVQLAFLEAGLDVDELSENM